MSLISNLLTNPQYWLDRAEEIRVLPERTVCAETKRMLETIVADNELLARRAEERPRGSTLEQLRLVAQPAGTKIQVDNQLSKVSINLHRIEPDQVIIEWTPAKA
jgi:hypothetical protein